DRVPSPGPGPAAEAAPGAVPGPEPRREVAPGDAGAPDVQDGVDEQPIVAGDAAVLTGSAGHQVLDPVPRRRRSRSGAAWWALRGVSEGPQATQTDYLLSTRPRAVSLESAAGPWVGPG